MSEVRLASWYRFLGFCSKLIFYEVSQTRKLGNRIYGTNVRLHCVSHYSSRMYFNSHSFWY